MSEAPGVVFSFLFLPPLPAAQGPSGLLATEAHIHLPAAQHAHNAQWAHGMSWLRLLAREGFEQPIRVVIGAAGLQSLAPDDQAFLQTLPLHVLPEKNFSKGGKGWGLNPLRAAWQHYQHRQALKKLLTSRQHIIVVWEEKAHRSFKGLAPVFCPSPAQHLPWQGSTVVTKPSPEMATGHAADRTLLQAVNDQLCAGAAYFLVRDAATALDDLLVLLKAFSLFKKWTKSHMKLVFAEKTVLATPGFREKLETYKYRSDLVFWEEGGGAPGATPPVVVGHADPGDPSPGELTPPKESDLAMPTLSTLTAAAYAVVLPHPQISWAWGFVDAVQAQVPVLVPEDFTLDASWTGKIYTAAFQDPDSLGAQLQLLYRNEKLRGERLEAAFAHLQAMDPSAKAKAFWAAVHAA